MKRGSQSNDNSLESIEDFKTVSHGGGEDGLASGSKSYSKVNTGQPSYLTKLKKFLPHKTDIGMTG